MSTNYYINWCMIGDLLGVLRGILRGVGVVVGVGSVFRAKQQ